LIYDTGLAARADGSGSVFAVRVFRADQPLLTGESFRMADLEAVELGVYRAQDGKRLFSVSMRDPAASTAGYAISPQGEVALFAQDHVELFAMPKN
jgi:hypothetical protein